MTLDIYAGLFADDLAAVAAGIDRLGTASATDAPANDEDQDDDAAGVLTPA